MDLEFDYYKNVKEKPIEWLWYPYIAYGKITLIQGDPGNGKSTLAINIASLLSNGKNLPFENESANPITVVYQNNEDGKEDTICPRLKNCGANLGNIAYIKETDTTLSMDDERIEKVIEETGARVLILDPYQAYFGSNVDMNRASSTRQSLGKLGKIAERRNCAVILIGHMSKAQNQNDLYRSLGSIDIPAIARSVLLVSKMPTGDNDRMLTQIKNNLAPLGSSILFTIMANSNIKWIRHSNLTLVNLINDNYNEPKTKLESACFSIMNLLKNGPMLASDVEENLKKENIATRTIYEAKRRIEVQSYRKGGKWFWYLDGVEEGKDK